MTTTSRAVCGNRISMVRLTRLNVEDEMERKRGHSKLVYNKKLRTIITVKPSIWQRLWWRLTDRFLR